MKIQMIGPSGEVTKEITNLPCPVCGKDAPLVETIVHPEGCEYVRGVFACCEHDNRGFYPAKVVS